MSKKHRQQHATQCRVPHDDKHAHSAAPGMNVCRGCYERAERGLAALPSMWRALLRVHVGQGDGLHVSATPDYVPYRDIVGDERALTAQQLRQWAKYTASTRDMTLPAGYGVDQHARFLAIHLPWLAATDVAADFIDTIHARYATATALLHPTNRRTFTITNPDGTPARCLDCGEPLAAVLRSTDDLLPSEIRCVGCGVAIPASAWITYGRQLRRRLEAAAVAT